MRRRTLDLMFSWAGLVMAGLLVVAALVLADRADFSKNYVRDQLTQQSLAFPAAKALLPQEKAFTQARSGCVLTYAGQEVTTGKQAECYANEYIGGHLTWLATRLGMTQVSYVDGLNYRQLGAELATIKVQIAGAEQAKAATVPRLQQKLADVTTVRQKMFEGTMLRNALLTSYGFSQLGDMARITSLVCWALGALLALLAVAGFVHAYRTPRSQPFAPTTAVEVGHRIPAHA